MNVPRKYALIISGILLVAASVALLVSRSRATGGREGEPESSASVAGEGSVYQPHYTIDPKAMDPDEVRSRLEVAALERITDRFPSNSDIPQPEELALEFGSAIQRYVFGSADDFVSYIASMEDLSEESLEMFRNQWEIGSQIVSMAPLDDAGIIVSQSLDDGYPVERATIGIERLDGTRRGAGGIDDPKAEGYDVFEIAVPMRINPYHGKANDGYFGLSFAYHRTLKKWVLVGVSVSRDGGDGDLLVPPL